MNIPIAVKSVGQYIKRAEELERDVNNPDRDIIAFWCRQYALDKSISAYAEADVAAFIDELMNIQERNKPKVGDKTTGRGACENQAHMIFGRADTEDRAGHATQSTAKLFYNAVSYFSILDQFDELKGDEQIKNMKSYASWKATDIINALKQGRVPNAGGPDAPMTSTLAPAASNINAAMPTVPAYQAPAPAPTPSAPSVSSTIGTVYNYVESALKGPQTSETATSGFQRREPPKGPQDDRVKDAIELCSFAISSMKYGDIRGATVKLHAALSKLE